MRSRGVRLMVALASAAIALSACAAPAVTHVGSGQAGLFFDVPRSWTAIGDGLLNKAEAGWNVDDAGAAIASGITWQAAYVMDPSTVVADIFSNVAPDSPIVLAQVRPLLDLEKSAIAADVLTSLQDVVLPVSDASAGDGLDVRVNQSILLDGRRGIRQTLGWTVGGKPQTVRTEIVLSKDESTVFTFIARCSDSCLIDYGQTIDDVMSSITVKEPNVG